MPESLTTRMARWGFNWLPAYRGTGSRIEYIADDWMEVRIRLPLNWRTRNYVGTIFGGSMYGAIDPVYMVMLIKILGRRYEVWDKSASIRFRRPGRATLRAVFRLDRGEIEATRADVDASGKTDRRYLVELINDAGEVCATCEKIVHVRLRKDAPGAPERNNQS